MSKAANIETVIKALKDSGITNPVSISGIMAIVAKESGFVPQSEKSYSGTSNARIREIFSKTRTLSESALSALKKDPVQFFNFVYGGRYGNAANEGYKYRGRGFNQITFKDQYKYYSSVLGIDLVSNPDLLNQPAIAAKALAAYMQRQFKQYPQIIFQRYGARNINDFRETKTAVNAFYNANAGLGKDTSTVSTTGKTQALSVVQNIYSATLKFLASPEGKFTSLATLFLVAGITYILIS